MAAEMSFYAAVPLEALVTDYSYRSLWWAAIIFGIAFSVTFAYLKLKCSVSSCLWEAPGTKASPLMVSLAIVKSVCMNKIAHHNVGK
ncbi:hypothetical protein JTE90_009011 [Oedothorax gibbosus]|uniref:Uncharacterized protein n=1 Tax=Oedothorax gibbosus TaxID=931172 RepID=A0AAV6VMB0_9ARAC|nr:hypothetical protein JTE90_009011 [Oedothorax gibbosus]